MKKTLLSLATLVTAGLLSMAADCSGSNVTTCTDDTACADGEICVIADGETEGACELAQCTANEDCALADATSDFLCPIDKGGAGCADDVNGCADGAVEVVDTLGTSFCGVEEDEANDFDCEDPEIGGVAIDVEAAAGGTVTICVDAAGTCTDGQCG
jgi:hypothetical protein